MNSKTWMPRIDLTLTAECFLFCINGDDYENMLSNRSWLGNSMTKLILADYQTFFTNNFFFPFLKYLAIKSVRITSTGLSKFPEICPDSGTGYSQRIRQILSGLTLGVGQKITNFVWIRTLPPLPLPRVLPEFTGLLPHCQNSFSVVWHRQSPNWWGTLSQL